MEIQVVKIGRFYILCQENYNRWLTSDCLTKEAYDQLKNMPDHEKKERFWTSLSFGTGGLRAKMGLGTNCMNIFTVSKAASGMADYIFQNQKEGKEQGVAIAYDSRHHSYEFAEAAACALAAKGITAYLFRDMRPTPLLSFAVRFLNLSGGIVITASHNPPEYNGFKAYGSDGAQFSSFAAEQLAACIENIKDELLLKTDSKEEYIRTGKILILDDLIDHAYLQTLDALRFCKTEEIDRNVSVVFTSLHGTAITLFPHLMERNGFTNIHLVKEQCVPNGDFPTVEVPNPEVKAAFSQAILKAKKVKADLVIACDPDADRLGIVVRNLQGTYEYLSGNQIAALCVNYLIQQRRKNQILFPNGTLIDTIVSSPFAAAIATAHGLKHMRTPIGFKYIAERIHVLEKDASTQFFMGYEESYGYLFLDVVRDKDAFQASLILTEMAAYYKKQNKSLLEVLQQLYEKYGYFNEETESIMFSGWEGMKKIEQIMAVFYALDIPGFFGDYEVLYMEDYLEQKVKFPDGTTEILSGFPKVPMIRLIFVHDAWLAVRPSGTEPKIKFYYGVKEASYTKTLEKIQELKSWLHHLLKKSGIEIGH